MTNARTEPRASRDGAHKRSEAASTAALLSSGADQAGVRLYNERLLLSLVRRLARCRKSKSRG